MALSRKAPGVRSGFDRSGRTGVIVQHPAAEGRLELGSNPTRIGTRLQAEQPFCVAAADRLDLPGIELGRDDVLDGIVPELQRRGLAQTEYAPGTFRDKLAAR